MVRLRGLSHKVIIFITVFVVFVFNAVSVFGYSQNDLLVNGKYYFPPFNSTISSYDNVFAYTRKSDGNLVFVCFNGSYYFDIDSTSTLILVHSDTLYRYTISANTWTYSVYDTFPSATTLMYTKSVSSISDWGICYSNFDLLDKDGNVLQSANTSDVVFTNSYNDIPFAPDYDSWYSNIFDGIQAWIGGVLGGLVEPFQNMADGISGVWSAVTDLPGDIADNIKHFFTDLGDKIEDVWDSVKTGFSNLGDKIVDLWDSVKTGFKDVVDGIKNIPQKIADKIEYLFTPTVNIFVLIKDKFVNKFPIVGQVSGLFDSLYNIGTTEPSFSFSYKGVSLKLIDFTSFSAYMPTVRAYTSVFIWLSFLSKEVKRLPALIRGRDTDNSGGDDTNVN